MNWKTSMQFLNEEFIEFKDKKYVMIKKYKM